LIHQEDPNMMRSTNKLLPLDDSIRFDSQCVLERLSFLSGNKQQSNNTILVLLQLLASESVTSSQKHDHHVFNF
jgi:hypothetical protein